MKKEEEIYEARFQKHIDELKWLYMELYDDQEHFDELCASMKQFYDTRKKGLKASDLTRETDPNWYKGSDILGMMMYTKMFGGNLKGVKKHLDYLKECGINYLHLMPLMESPKDRSDGGRFQKGTAGAGNDPGSGVTGFGMPETGDQHLPGFCHEPYFRRS